MQHRTKRKPAFDSEITIRLALDVPAEKLGLADGYQRVFGNEGKRKKKKKTAGEEGFLLSCRNTAPDANSPDGGCVCEITAQRETAEWEKISPSDYYRYADAAAAGYLRLIKERLRVDLAPRIDGVRIDTPLTECLRRPDDAPEALLKNARKLFPEKQKMVVTEADDRAGLTVLTLRKSDGFTAAWFRPGQYILVSAGNDTGEAEPFLLCGSPALTREGKYRAASLRPRGGAAAAVSRFPVGTAVEVSAPRGDFCHDALRDRPTVIGVTDRSGAAAFLSAAAAVRDGLNRIKLTVLYLQEEEDIPFPEEFEQICRRCGRVRLICLPARNGEQAFSAASLRSVLPHEAYSVFICGKEETCASARKALEELKLPGRNVRVCRTEQYGTDKNTPVVFTTGDVRI